jgi:hypothetical protein
MSDVYPSGQTAGAGTQAVVEPRVLTDAETAQLDLLYTELKPQAIAAARSYVMNRTPANLQEAMTAKIDADFPPPPPPAPPA